MAGVGTPSRRPREHLLAWGFLLPSLVVFGLFIFWPLGRSLYLSTHGSDLFGGAGRFTGLDNYRDLFVADGFGKVLVTTALFTVLSVLPSVAGALIVVLLLESRIRGTRLF